jgi:hypothetical protein
MVYIMAFGISLHHRLGMRSSTVQLGQPSAIHIFKPLPRVFDTVNLNVTYSLRASASDRPDPRRLTSIIRSPHAEFPARHPLGTLSSR